MIDKIKDDLVKAMIESEDAFNRWYLKQLDDTNSKLFGLSLPCIFSNFIRGEKK